MGQDIKFSNLKLIIQTLYQLIHAHIDYIVVFFNMYNKIKNN